MKLFFGIIISVIAIFILSACGRGNETSNRWEDWDGWENGEIGGTAGTAEPGGFTEDLPVLPPIRPESGETEENGGLSGNLRIFSPGYPGRQFAFYIERFTELHPNVNIIVDAVEEHWSVSDMSGQMALNTRLLTEPADIFIPPFGASFEKVVMEALFADLNDFMRGERGINPDDYFANVFAAAEQQGGLFLVPLYVSPFDAVRALNIELFESIGVNAREIETITIDELLAYYLRIAVANPGRDIELTDNFSFMYLLMEGAVYDVDTLTVNVNTPEMTARFEQALDMRIGRNVTFNPGSWWFGVQTFGIGWSPRFLDPSDIIYLNSFDVLADLALLIAADHPNMQFTPVRRISSDGYVRFENDRLTFGIMQNSPTQDLAWEFIRFMLEFDESVVNPVHGSFPVSPPGYLSHINFPVNRARFEAQVTDIISRNYTGIAEVMNLDLFMEVDGEHRRRSIETAFDFFHDIMNSFNRQVRHSDAVFNSLVYPDIWLLHTGQQNVAQTLASIQSRLELYVHE